MGLGLALAKRTVSSVHCRFLRWRWWCRWFSPSLPSNILISTTPQLWSTVHHYPWRIVDTYELPHVPSSRSSTQCFILLTQQTPKLQDSSPSCLSTFARTSAAECPRFNSRDGDSARIGGRLIWRWIEYCVLAHGSVHRRLVYLPT